MFMVPFILVILVTYINTNEIQLFSFYLVFICICIQAAYGTVTLYKSSWWPVDTQLSIDRSPGNLIESDGTICCLYTILSS